jgi:hypothetical protein
LSERGLVRVLLFQGLAQRGEHRRFELLNQEGDASDPVLSSPGKRPRLREGDYMLKLAVRHVTNYQSWRVRRLGRERAAAGDAGVTGPRQPLAAARLR